MIDVPTRVKDALREGDRLKRYRFVVDSDPVITITNDNLVSESVTFDERMCSDKEIKFGLCEGTNLEFQYFGLPNITGHRLQAFIDVQYKDSDGELKWHEIPMGWFEVSESSRQASTGIIKVSAFNKLQSEYLDNKINGDLAEMFAHDPDHVYLVDIIDNMLDGYGIYHYDMQEIFPSYSTEDWGRSELNSVAAYKYSTITLLQGCFSPYILRKYGNASTSSTIYLATYGAYKKYNIEDSAYADYPIRVVMTEDYGVIDENITNFWLYNIEQIRTNTSSDTIWDKMYNHQVYLSNGDILPAWGLQVTIVFNDDSQKTYSNSLYAKGKASGTFEDLARLTFMNVKSIILYQPLGASYEYPQNRIYDFEEDTNIRYCYGEDRTVEFELTEGGTVYTATYETPTMPDGVTKIPASQIFSWMKVFAVVNMPEIETLTFDVDEMADVTLRDLQSAVFEIDCQYGKLDRQTDLFSGVELNNSRLLPAEDLYPANDLYPNSIAERSNPAMYSKLWADEGNVRKFRYLIITYKGTETEGGQTREVEKTLQRTVDENGTDDYNMSDNWLFKNLVWTDEEIEDYADAMVAKMQNLTWFPFEMWCAGLPYVETGDELEINVNGEAYTSYVLRRNLRGIQNLQDEMINGELDIF